MLVIISDLHLTDGTTAKTVSADAFERFRGRLQELAYFASFRGETGKYVPLERIDLLLLGDILDVVRSTRWSDEIPGDANYARPWNDLQDAQQRAQLVRKVEQIGDGILANNATSFRQLRDLAGDKPLTLPPATDWGGPARGGERLPVETRISYLVGNHDWFWHVPGIDFEPIRSRITSALGLANPTGPYPHDPLESGEISRTLRDHRVFARHGDIYDSFNYDSRGRDFASLGDAIVIDLINGFPVEVRKQLRDDLPVEFLDGLDEIGNVRPRLLTPIWIQALLGQYEIDKATAVEVRRIWDEITDEMLESDFVRQQDTINPLDAVDIMEATLKFTRLLSFDTITDLVTWITNKVWGGDISFAKNAVKENAFKKRTANYFVYGHTHHYEASPLAITHKDGQPFKQWCFNSGTWHPLYDVTKDGKNFIGHKVFTYLTFYKDDERKGRQYETWSGTLFD
ncbi:MAG: hypothetical protein ACK2UR_20390 [Candidatus Promineifilaceae bacterium]